MLKKTLISMIVLVTVGAALFHGGKSWLKSLLPDKAHFQVLKQSQTQDLPYVMENIPESRGKILAVLTSTDKMGDDKDTGYEHTELARAYYVFVANGFEVEFASPLGGEPPRVLDGEDMGAYDYAFLNDASIQKRLSQSIPLADIDPEHYEAVYYVGGKGTMFDFPDNPDIQRITKQMYQDGKVVSAVCHGPAALVNVKLDNGDWLLTDKSVSGFTNEEELIIIPDAKEIFPFLLEDKLVEQGANFKPGKTYLEKVSQDGKLITGQNPWSVWKMAEMVVKELGYTPKVRSKTPEEYSIALLQTYEEQGLQAAQQALMKNPESYQQILLLMHGMLALMQFELGKSIDIFSLAHTLKAELQA
ncbi:type 1 glutamine amidotransferase domain-containing protein [Planctobacterium marinum]|uniref:DJ-1/PfpI domain-containing protein n=1 Tax=Planctobacterium marinum TaxID=1631968 RepID=A0AA48HPX6_9ALTE|nr:hypothetical protein MACH26_13550 [Planctobacterium marinum]